MNLRDYKNNNIISLFIGFIFTILILNISMSSFGDSLKFRIDRKLFTDKFLNVNIKSNNERLDNIFKFYTKNNIFGIYKNIDKVLQIENENILPIDILAINDKNLKAIDNKYLNGQLFNTNDIEYETNRVIVGENVFKNSYLKDGKHYIKIEKFNKEYEIINVIKNNTELDNKILIPFMSIPSYYFDSKMENYEILVDKNIDINKISHINNYSSLSTQTYLQIIFQTLKFEIDLFISTSVSLIMAFIVLVSFTLLWIESQKEKLKIFKILGSSNRYIFKYIFTCLSSIMILAAPSSYLIYTVLSYLFNLTQINFNFIISMFILIFMLFINYIISIISIKKIFSFNKK